MARKAKPSSGPVGTSPLPTGPAETLEAVCLEEVLEAVIPAPDDILKQLSDTASLWFVQQLVYELLTKVKGSIERKPPAVVTDDSATVQTLGWTMQAAQCLTRACVAARIFPPEILDTFGEVSEQTNI